MKKYILTFTAAHVIAMLAVVAIESLFDLPSGTSMTCLIVGGFTAAASFVKDRQRVPNETEKKTLVWGCLLCLNHHQHHCDIDQYCCIP